MANIGYKVKIIVDKAKWSAFYMASFLSLYGTGNTISVESQSLEETLDLFKQGVVDVAPLTCGINLVYASAVSLLNKTNHPRLYSNIFCAVVNAGMYSFLSMNGTENPLPMVMAGSTLGFTLTNVQVSKEQNKKIVSLESQVNM
jgi:hypothetical protein